MLRRLDVVKKLNAKPRIFEICVLNDGGWIRECELAQDVERRNFRISLRSQAGSVEVSCGTLEEARAEFEHLSQISREGLYDLSMQPCA